MTKDDMEIATSFKVALSERIGPQRFDLWFGGGTQLRVIDGGLVVSTSEEFALDRLRKHFRADIEAVCNVLLPGKSHVEFRLDSSLSRSELEEKNKPRASSRRSKGEEPSTSADDDKQLGGFLASNHLGTRRLASLQNYVVGHGNRVAHMAAATTADRLGKVTPLFLYGPTGCGKTHLLEGLLNATRRTRSVRRCLMLSAEQFTSYFLEALQGSGLPSFRRKHRDLDLLLIDDVHFFAGKRATLVEVQHTIDTLLRQGRQLVLAADRPPTELAGLGPELVARMSGGLVCSVEEADQKTSLGILRQMCMLRNFSFPSQVLEEIATQLCGDARQLSGALNRVQATSEALHQPITLELAQEALADLIQTSRRVVRLGDIERAVCDVFGLEPSTLQSSRRAKTISHPRMLAMWLARKYTRSAYSEIGRYFGRRSHSTVISAQKKIDRWMSEQQPICLALGDCSVEDAIRRVETHLRAG